MAQRWLLFWICQLVVVAQITMVFCEGGSEAVGDRTAESGEEYVLVLTSDNFEDAIAQHRHILVEFYAPWCKHCQMLAPDYEKAAKKLHKEGSPIKLAKVDAIEENGLAKKSKIEKYPTVIFFRDGNPINYQSIQDHSAEEIVRWLKRKTNPAAEVITSQDELKRMHYDFNAVVVGFFKSEESPAVKDFVKVADETEEIHFVISYSPDLFTAYNINKDSVIMLRTFDEERVDLVGEIDERTLKEFVDINRLPHVVEFDPILATYVMENFVRKHVLYFISRTDKRFAERMKTFRETAKKFKGQAIFVFVDVDNADYKRILNWFYVKTERCPTTRLVDLEGPKGTLKYRPDADNWTSDELSQFVQEVLDGKREVYYVSEEIPEDWDSKPVKVLVGKNFHEIAKDPTKNVFVKFYAPWCGFSKDLAPKWEELAEKFKDDPDVVIAEVDATANEIEGNRVLIFPTMKFFPKASDEAIEFQNINTTVERLIEFVENGGTLPEDIQTSPEAKTEEKDSNQKKDKQKSEL